MRPSFYMRKYWVKPGKNRPLCIRVHRKAPSWARSSCNAFLSGKLWQYFVAVRPRRGPGQEKRPFAARYRRHASKMSWFWQDMLPMYSKCPAKRRLGIHLAGILSSRRPFPVRISQIMHNGQILPRFFDSSFVWELCDSCLRARFGARPALRFVLHCGISVFPRVKVQTLWLVLYAEAAASPSVLYVEVSAL